MKKLLSIIESLDGQSVTMYNKLCGRYERDGFVYNIRSISSGQHKYAMIDIEINEKDLYGVYSYETMDLPAISSYIMREFSFAAKMANDEMQQSEENKHKGYFIPYKFSSRILTNSAVRFMDGNVVISLRVKMPHNTSEYAEGSFLAMSKKARETAFRNQKKSIISAQALKLFLTKNLPSLVNSFVSEFNTEELFRTVLLFRDQNYIRIFLKNNGYVSFIANGSILPRKGKTDYKDSRGVKLFKSPESMEIQISLPSGKTISGMAVPRGVTLITGDAYHGKSTILEAVKEGVYNHVPGDGREYVITESSAVSIQSEDGRSIKNTDISFFLRKLPIKSIEPKSFSTDNASGSTSQAAAVAEAIESNCRLMLFDEDRCANNFMYKDDKMRKVIKNASTSPFIDNVQMFYETFGISSIIVVGASGEYFRVADKVILVENFAVSEYVDYEYAKYIQKNSYSPSRRLADLQELSEICLKRNIEIKDDATIRFGSEVVNVNDIIPHVTRGQLDFICSFIYFLTVYEGRQNCILKDHVMKLYDKIQKNGIDLIHQNGLRGAQEIIEYVRPEDILSVLYRIRSVKFEC